VLPEFAETAIHSPGALAENGKPALVAGTATPVRVHAASPSTA
jgi:hypothetical protein